MGDWLPFLWTLLVGLVMGLVMGSGWSARRMEAVATLTESRGRILLLLLVAAFLLGVFVTYALLGWNI